MKRLYYTCLLVFSSFIVVIVSLLFQSKLIGYFSSYLGVQSSIGTGNLTFSIENLEISQGNREINQIIKKKSNKNESFLMINSSKVFSFSVINSGTAAIRYSLEIGIVWEGNLNETGKLFLYPTSMDDLAIFNNIENENGSSAIIGGTVSDQKYIHSSSGIRKGILETIDYSALDSLYYNAEGSNGNLKKNYAFKLFFFDGSEIYSTLTDYHQKYIEVIINVHSDIHDRESGWAHTESKYFHVITNVDYVPPVISEVQGLPKEIFIAEAEHINLADYVIATDNIDGVITDDIVIDSQPSFNKDKSGTYVISYNVKDKMGNAAEELNITIVIWDFIKLESGNYHTLALTSHGYVYSWGINISGQLGDGTYINNNTPKIVEGLNNIIDIAVGVGCSYALTSDGYIYSWGLNLNGRLGDNTTTDRNRPVPVVQPKGIKFVQISANSATAAALTENGDIYTWGYGLYGAAGTGNSTENHIPTKIGIGNIAQVSMGYYNGIAVTFDGKVYTWGDNARGQLGNGKAPAVGTNAPEIVPYFINQNIKIKQVSAGLYHMGAVSEDGAVYTWGHGAEGRLGNNATTDHNTPQLIEFPKIAVQIITAYYHTAVRTADGFVYFFGQNGYGKHGSGDTTNHLKPYLLSSVNNVTYISLALDSSFVLSEGKLVYGMGYGGSGALGIGEDRSSTTPVQWAFSPPALPLLRKKICL